MRLRGAGGPLAVAATLAVAGCAGVSNAEFAKRADRVCSGANSSLAPAPLGPKASFTEASRYAEQEIIYLSTVDAKLRSLTTPEDLKGDMVSFGADTQRLIRIVQRRRAAALARNVKRYQALVQQFGKVALDRERYGVRLGFRVCGRRRPR
jgi:hypothetical protein